MYLEEIIEDIQLESDKFESKAVLTVMMLSDCSKAVRDLRMLQGESFTSE